MYFLKKIYYLLKGPKFPPGTVIHYHGRWIKIDKVKRGDSIVSYFYQIPDTDMWISESLVEFYKNRI